jgi:hypothetical protein
MRTNFVFSLRNLGVLFLASVVFSQSACKKKSAPPPSQTEEEASPSIAPKAAEEISKPKAAVALPAGEPAHIVVQHILIGYKGSLPGKNVSRSKAEAEKLAMEILKRAKKGENFEKLVKAYTDDQAPGIYAMSNTGVEPVGDEFPRDGMVPAFGNIGFKLKEDEIDIAKFHAQDSPFGYHIIKRLKAKK